MDLGAWEEKLREYDERTFADWMDGEKEESNAAEDMEWECSVYMHLSEAESVDAAE